MNKAFAIMTLLIIGGAIYAGVAHADDDEHEYEREDHSHEYDDHDDWDFSDDWQNVAVADVQPPAEPTPVEATPPKSDITIPEVNLSLYGDDDNDGVLNKDDQYPGQNDLQLRDSDGDGVSDYYDEFPGRNDKDYQDVDHDGVIDSQDSDLTKATDKDHDGIDDAYDDHDDRPFGVKVLSWLGIAG